MTNRERVMNKIAVIGAGYVGLVTGVCFAQKRENFVILIERDKKKIEALKKGEVPFYESGLDILLKNAIEQNKIVDSYTLMDFLEKPTSNALRVNIAKLKNKLGIEIKNIRGRGYMIEKI